MNTDRLENFIREHRKEFDDRRAPELAWDRIPSKKRISLKRVYTRAAVAATMLLLITVSFVIGMRTAGKENIEGWTQFQEAEQYYEMRIRQRMEQIKTVSHDTEVLSDVEVLDEVYLQLREQLLQNPQANPKHLLSVMIRHQQQKLKVMDNILERIEKYQPTQITSTHEM